MPATLSPATELTIALITPLPLIAVWLLFVATHNRIVRDPARRIAPHAWQNAVLMYIVALGLAAINIFLVH